MPGTYTITLQVNGKTYTQPIEIKIDPRVKTSVQDLQKQHDLSMICYEGRKKQSIKIQHCIENLVRYLKY